MEEAESSSAGSWFLSLVFYRGVYDVSQINSLMLLTKVYTSLEMPS